MTLNKLLKSDVTKTAIGTGLALAIVVPLITWGINKLGVKIPGRG